MGQISGISTTGVSRTTLNSLCAEGCVSVSDKLKLDSAFTAGVGQVVSKHRVANHGEVFTHPREVNAMLDLVHQETERIDSRFLEPACGTGNFVVEILARKLGVVASRYAKSQLEYERYAVLAVSSIYGIDILSDNVIECRKRLLEVFDYYYIALFDIPKDECRDSVRYILRRNIIHGDALTLKTVGDSKTPSQPIVFSEWSAVNGSLLKRRDYIFAELFEETHASVKTDFTSSYDKGLISDSGEKAFIPEPVQDFPLTHFLRLAYAG